MLNRESSRKQTTRAARSRTGATTVELACIAPLFFLIVFAIMEFSRAVMIQQSLTDAARAGARTAALASTINQSTAEAAARNYLSQTMSSSFDMSQCQINVSPGALGTMSSGSEITVTVGMNYNDVTWVLPTAMKNVVLRGEATMTKE